MSERQDDEAINEEAIDEIRAWCYDSVTTY